MVHNRPRMVATRTQSWAQIVTRLHFHKLTSFEVVTVNEAHHTFPVTSGLPSVVMFRCRTSSRTTIFFGRRQPINTLGGSTFNLGCAKVCHTRASGQVIMRQLSFEPRSPRQRYPPQQWTTRFIARSQACVMP